MSRLHLPLVLGCLVSSCAEQATDLLQLNQPVFGRNTDTTFVVSPGSGEIKVRDMAAITRVLRRYKTLDAAEKQLIRLAVRRHFDGLVALEIKKVERAHEPERRKLQALASPVERRAAEQRLAATVLEEATKRVADQLQGLLAVPLPAVSNHSVIAFARYSSTDIRVADAAYEIDKPLAQIGSGTKVPSPDSAQDRELAAMTTSRTSVATVISGENVAIK